MKSLSFRHALLAAVAAVLVGCSGSEQPRYDVVIRNGTVFDGTGASGFQADIGIVRDRIVYIGDLSHATAPVSIDASGLYVAPGFINLHSHPEKDGLQSAVNMLTQGVVTEIVNADGFSPLDISEQLAQYRDAGLALNVGAYVGLGSIWQSVVGDEDRRPSAEEIDRMRALLVKNLQAGAWGVSSGLDYKPSYYATTEEVVAIVESAAPWRTNFPNHDRLTPESNFSSRVGIAETLTIGERTGVMPVVTHMKVQGAEQGTAKEVLDLITQVNARGHYAAADVYPYLAGFTGLAALLVPGWALEGGREAMLARFEDPTQRRKIAREIERAMNVRFGGPRGVFVVNTNQELVDVMEELDVPAGEAVMRLLERDEMSAVLRFGAEEDLVRILQYPTAAIACDCGATADVNNPGMRHPRMYGTFPRVLGRYVRESGLLSWQDAIRKMTGLPATMIGLVDRGFIKPGMKADIAVFDPNTIIDHATFTEPVQLSEGMRYVLVNGKVALSDGKPTGTRAGTVLERTINMPSRPMTGISPRRIEGRAVLASGEAAAEGYEIVFEVSQETNQSGARGTLELYDRASKQRLIEVRDFGLLQTTKGWASVTASASDENGAPIGVMLIVDAADPTAGDGRTTIVVEADGLPRLIGHVASTAVRLETGT
ncbi:MAG TPA: amidohydrolase family protein [Steroidobacter sp.]